MYLLVWRIFITLLKNDTSLHQHVAEGNPLKQLFLFHPVRGCHCTVLAVVTRSHLPRSVMSAKSPRKVHKLNIQESFSAGGTPICNYVDCTRLWGKITKKKFDMHCPNGNLPFGKQRCPKRLKRRQPLPQLLLLPPPLPSLYTIP